MKLFLMFSFAFLMSCVRSGDDNLPVDRSIKISQDIQLQLTMAEFDKLVASKITSGHIDSTKAMEIVRVYNSINKYDLKDSVYSKYVHEVDEQYFYELFKILRFRRWKGGGLYSNEFDIFLGGPPTHNNSYFLLK